VSGGRRWLASRLRGVRSEPQRNWIRATSSTCIPPKCERSQARRAGAASGEVRQDSSRVLFNLVGRDPGSRADYRMEFRQPQPGRAWPGTQGKRDARNPQRNTAQLSAVAGPISALRLRVFVVGSVSAILADAQDDQISSTQTTKLGCLRAITSTSTIGRPSR
jgi:hypothetical protein